MVGGRPGPGVRKRAVIICAVLSAVFVLLCARILFIQIFNFDEYDQKVRDQITRETTVGANRGNIYDTNGVVIATNITTYRLFLDPAAIARQSRKDGVDYADMIAKGISAIESLEVSYDYVIEQSAQTKYRDRTLARHISEEQADEVRKLLSESKLDNKALLFLEATSKRYYPYDTLASHVLGFTGSDGTGMYGLELTYNELLRGVDGKYIGARDTYGNELVYDYESYVPAIDGYSITTTIDVFIQAELEEQLKTSYIESGGKNRACGIVMDTETGAILAMAVYPPYDLNNPSKLDEDSQRKLDESGLDKDSEEYTALRLELLQVMWNNKAISDPYMPGSTFKVLTAAMAYEEDIVNKDETFLCAGGYRVHDRWIKCHLHSGHGNVTFDYGLQQSCNPALMQMGLRLGAENYFRYFSELGYFEKTGIDAPGEEYTRLGVTFWNEKDFVDSALSDLNLAVASFGQNFKISPIAHITAINTIANGGDLVTPHLIKEITDKDGNVVYSYEASIRRQVFSEDTCTTVSTILEEGVSTDGGSKAAYVPGYRIAAKTGTSEKKDVTDTEYIPYICSAVAFAPAEAPKVSVLFMVDEPTDGVLYASVIAAPYVGSLLEEILPYCGVTPIYEEDEREPTISPWVYDWDIEDAVERGEMFGFKVEVVGDGNKVLAQSPKSGEYVDPENPRLILYTTEESIEEKNKEENLVVVPDLVGKTAVAANGVLTSYGLNVRLFGTANYQSNDVIVLTQSPAAGEKVTRGTVVSITLGDKNNSDGTFFEPDADISGN